VIIKTFYMQNLLVILIYGIVFSTCNTQKIIKSKKYYKDFDMINVEGINEITSDKLIHPYVEIIKYEDSSLNILFHISPKSSFLKKYVNEGGVLKSNYYLRTNDAGCNGFTELQYYFTKGKMITYVFCGKVDFPSYDKIYKIYKEELHSSDTSYKYSLKSVVIQSFFDKQIKSSISFSPNADYDGAFFEDEGALVEESSIYTQRDSLYEIGKSYYTVKNGSKRYVSNNRFVSFNKKPNPSIWKNLDDNFGF